MLDEKFTSEIIMKNSNCYMINDENKINTNLHDGPLPILTVDQSKEV